MTTTVSRKPGTFVTALFFSVVGLAGLVEPAAASTIHTTQTPIGGAGPPATDAADGVPYELGMQFQSSVDGIITAIRYWRADSETSADNSHVGNIWGADGALLASVSFVGETPCGADCWQEQALAVPLAIVASTTYTVSVNILSHYVYTKNGLENAIINGDLASVAGSNLGSCTGPAAANGVYGSPGTFPTQSFNCANYFRDVRFTPAQVVPVPAAAWLFMSGVSLLGLVRRRRLVARDH